MRYAEDSAAVGHAAKRAAETLAVDFYWALEQSRSLRMSWQERDMPFREWLLSEDINQLIGGGEGLAFVREFKRLQSVIEADDRWVVKEVNRYFRVQLGELTVELDLDCPVPYFRGVSHMAIHQSA